MNAAANAGRVCGLTDGRCSRSPQMGPARVQDSVPEVTPRLWRSQYLKRVGERALREMQTMCRQQQQMFEDEGHNLFWVWMGYFPGWRPPASCLLFPCRASLGASVRFSMVIKRLKSLSFDSLVYCNILHVTGSSKSCLWLLKHKESGE